MYNMRLPHCPVEVGTLFIIFKHIYLQRIILALAYLAYIRKKSDKSRQMG